MSSFLFGMFRNILTIPLFFDVFNVLLDPCHCSFHFLDNYSNSILINLTKSILDVLPNIEKFKHYWVTHLVLWPFKPS